MASNFSILVDVELQTNTIQKQLDSVTKNLKINVDSKDLDNVSNAAKNAKSGTDDLAFSARELGLTFQEANLIFSRSVEAISSMVQQVYELDSALIEFRKVSDLSGESLDNYVSQLQTMGQAVARTGKPKGLAPDDGMVNQHHKPLEIQYSLRAYSTTIVT